MPDDVGNDETQIIHREYTESIAMQYRLRWNRTKRQASVYRQSDNERCANVCMCWMGGWREELSKSEEKLLKRVGQLAGG